MWVGVEVRICYVHLNSRTMGGQITIPILFRAVVCQTPTSCALSRAHGPFLWLDDLCSTSLPFHPIGWVPSQALPTRRLHGYDIVFAIVFAPKPHPSGNATKATTHPHQPSRWLPQVFPGLFRHTDRLSRLAVRDRRFTRHLTPTAALVTSTARGQRFIVGRLTKLAALSTASPR